MTKDQINDCINKALALNLSLKREHGKIFFGRFDMSALFRNFADEFFKLQLTTAGDGTEYEVAGEVEVFNEGGSGEFRVVKGLEKLPHGTQIYIRKG